MTIYEFLEQNLNLLSNEIIPLLESDFSSHDFLKKFAKRFEGDYINFLHNYGGTGAFKTVHGQIAKFLADNETKLNIHKKQKVRSENVFGEMDEIQGWKKN
jgi:hypothetical protein